MAKVRIGTSREVIEIEANDTGDGFYDDLPFTSGNVLWTEIKD